MTERGLPIADGATACPFVAFEHDRDERAAAPDHRHRCYAEQRPAPRALAHQEAYCLSSAFPVCPTFQEWARREAARAHGDATEARSSPPAGDETSPSVATSAVAGAAASAGAGAAVVGRDTPGPGGDAAAAAAGGDAEDVEPAPESEPPPLDPVPLDDPNERPSTEAADDDDASSDRGDEPVQRNPPRDWAAPPPWLASSEGRRPLDDAAAPSFLGRRSEPGAGLAGSPADQMAGGAPPIRRTEQVEELWGAAATGAAVAGVAAGAAAGSSAAGSARPAVPDEYASVEGAPGRVSRRPRAYDQHLGGPDGPDWERPRRSEAYPTIKTRVGMPEVPRIAIMAVAVGILAIALLLLPGFLNLGGGGGSTPGATASPSGTVRESLAPTEPPAPSPTVYTIKKGDTLLKVAKAHGLTLDELLAANPAIKNPNKVSEGQQIVIPVPSESPSAVAKPSAARSGGSAAP